MKRLLILTLAIGLLCAVELSARAQAQPAQQPTAEELEKQKEEREKNAYRLLDQVIDEAQSLRLTENRVRVQINAGDMLWDKNQARARSLFTMAGDGIGELGRNTPVASGNRRGENTNQERRTYQLRQELILAVARHDAQLAYQLLASTKPPAQVAQASFDDSRFIRPQPAANSEENLEQMLLGRIAALDPKLAAQNAELMMEKGQFPRTLTEVIDQLYRQDPEAGAKLADKTVKRLQGANILTNNEAATLAQTLLSGGVRPPAGDSASSSANTTSLPTRRAPALEQSAYVDLLSSIIDAALKVTIPAQNNQQRGAAPRTRTPGAPVVVAPRPAQGNTPTEAQIEQSNARRLFAGLSALLPAIDQYLPARASAVRQKIAETGVTPPGPGLPQAAINLDNNMTADALAQLATTAPAQMQPRIYQQAAYRAIEEGNTDRARQLATDHLTSAMRDAVLRRAEVRDLAKKADTVRFDEIRQNLNRLQSDGEKLDFLLQLAGDAKKTNMKLATQLLDEARQITNRRAASYEHFDQQLKVARAFVSVDPARTFEVLEPGISQLNELLAAAAILNGFEINMFREGELTMQGGGGLTSTINRFGQELANLARTDIERSETLAGRFQMTEPRIMARIAIVQGLLRTPPPQQTGPNFNAPRPIGQNIARP